MPARLAIVPKVGFQPTIIRPPLVRIPSAILYLLEMRTAVFVGIPSWLSANFDRGTNGASVSTGGGGDPGNFTAWDAVGGPAGSSITYDNTRSAVGVQSGKVTASATLGPNVLSWISAFGTQTDHYGRFYSYLTSYTTGGNAPQVFIQDSTGATTCARIFVNQFGQLIVSDSTGANSAVSSNLFALNQWVRIEFHVVHSLTVGQLEAKLFNTADSDTPTETISATALNTQANAGRALFGTPSVTPAGMTVWFDGIVAGAAAYPGPAAATGVLVKQVNKPLTATAVTVTATLTTIKVFLKALTATVTTTATMVRQVNKTLTATTVATTATIQRQISKLLTATTTTSAAMIRKTLKNLTATAVTVTASLQSLKVILKVLTATVTVTASMTRQVAKAMTATVASTALLQRQTGKIMAATVTTSATMTRRIAKTLTATVTSVASLVTSFISGGAAVISTVFFGRARTAGGTDLGTPAGGTDVGTPGETGRYDPPTPGQT